MEKEETIQAHVEQLLICLENKLAGAKEANRQTNFTLALIARSLHAGHRSERARNIGHRLINELLKERRTDWTWNYHIGANNNIYPNDLDDTFCVLHAISLWKKDHLTGEVFALITKILIHNEVDVGGPYKTWIIDNRKWDDTDPWVNANIGAFLAFHNISLPNLEKYFDDVIGNRFPKSKYYLNQDSLYYFLSFWHKKHFPKICEAIISGQEANGSFGTLLSTAFSVCTLIRLNGDKSSIVKALNYILKNSSAVPNDPFYIDRIVDDKILYAESDAFTVALCIEALSLYLQSLSGLKNLHCEIEYIKTFHKYMYNWIKNIPKNMAKPLKEYVYTLLGKDARNEIILLPYRTSKNLRKRNVNSITVMSFSMANTLGWCAYSIYDQYIDSGNKDNIPLAFANIFQKEMILVYRDLHLNNALMHSILNQVEWAYWFEQSFLCCKNYAGKIPNKAIYGKSIGHVLPVVALLSAHGYKNNSKEIKSCIQFFKYYLLVRQLSDDAHDWKEDMMKGNVTQVTQHICRLQKKLGNSITREQIFWERVSLYTARRMLHSIHKAKYLFTDLKECFEDTDFLSDIIAPYKKIAQDIIDEHVKMLGFIEKMNRK